MDGLPALELWDLIISVFGNISHISDRTGQPVNGKNKSHNKINVIQDIDSVPSNVQSANREALLYVFEDNEAVIKMIMKGRSPTMRHVSRTHRVALDWLFDRINLDPKIQIKYIDTKNQLADILTKGNFTRDEWNHLLTLFDISFFSSTACIAAMAKRAQQGSGEGRVTAKSRPMMNLTARTPSFVSSSASSNPVRTSYGYQDPGKSVPIDDRTGKPVQGRLHKVQEDGYLKKRDDADKFNLAMDDENIDFNISGVPNAMVKRSQSISVHNLIQKIESHPQREAIQNDLQQHRAFNPFSKESKDAIMAAGNTELCEIINVEPKLQCKA